MASNTVKLQHVLRAPPVRIYRALPDPDAMVNWFQQNGYTEKVHHAKGNINLCYPNAFDIGDMTDAPGTGN